MNNCTKSYKHCVCRIDSLLISILSVFSRIWYVLLGQDLGVKILSLSAIVFLCSRRPLFLMYCICCTMYLFSRLWIKYKGKHWNE